MSEKTPLALTAAERKALKARAHHLNPVVIVGEAGLSEPVLAEAERAIAIHELVKIRVLGDDREARLELMGRLCDALGCAPVQMIGKLLVVFRPRPLEAIDRRDAPHVPKKIAGSGGKAKAKPRTGGTGSAAKTAARSLSGASRSRSVDATGGRAPSRGPRSTPLRTAAGQAGKPSGASTRGSRPIRFEDEGNSADRPARPAAPRGRRPGPAGEGSSPRQPATGLPRGRAAGPRKAASEQGRPTTRKPRASGGPAAGTRGAARKGVGANPRSRTKKR